ncbi:hypothetical protein [Bacillus salipaludis]|uniref:Uncharacterized protein n=1 Tax=Bacillus salipaludis TaxID=2547811 RepID=A0AA90R4Y9_9BACI|nr:hypothetical protein [Bacillus salipaludis]MDQ6595116.1 hypothetical protein [Bacillus salipaludis]
MEHKSRSMEHKQGESEHKMNAMEHKLEIPLKKVIKKGGINEKRSSRLKMGWENELSQARPGFLKGKKLMGTYNGGVRT